MGKNRISHRARDRIRQYDEERSPTFMPTISVVRRIMIDSEAGEQYQAKLKENLSKRLRRTREEHYRVINPNTVCLRLVDNARVEPRNAHDLAKALEYRLAGLIDTAPQFLAQPIGQIACFQEDHPVRSHHSKNIVGAVPVGWSAPSARRKTHDKQGVCTPMGYLAGERKICTEILGNVVKTPYAPMVINSHKIPKLELMLVEEAAREALPEGGFEWQDPQVILRTGPSAEDRAVMDVRAPVYNLAA